jgi:hypothetical protein
VGLGAIGVGAGQQHQHVGPGAEGAPRLHAVDHVAVLAGRAGCRVGGDLDACHVATEVGFGDGYGGHHLGRGQAGQPRLLLGLGTAFHQGSGEDLGAGDERTTDAERPAGQLLGGHHHGDVLAVASL